ncbi:MAG: fibronectin type III domain-containing protein [Chloroflexi bacterium]|nr:fibronectin type III domain-containing protein [Chloroflexota bacterium]
MAATAAPAGRIDLSWPALGWASNGYEIYRRPASSSTPALLATVTAGTTTYPDASTTDGTSYVYSVAGINARSVVGPLRDSATVTADATAPTLTTTANPTQGNTGTTIGVSVSASETLGAAPSVTVTGSCVPTTTVTMSPSGQATSYSGTYTVPVGGGGGDCTATIAASGTDVAGNASTGGSTTITVDRTAPSTSASLSGTAGTNGWYTSAVTTTLSATDATTGVATTYYAVDNSGCTSAALGNCSIYSSAFSVSTDGNHTVYFFSKDSAGNYEAQKTQQVKIDTVAPSASASLSGTAGSNGWYTSAVSVTLSGSDATSGVATTYYAVDNSSCTSAALGNCSTYSSAFSISSDGAHTVYFFSRDNAGNYGSQQTQAVNVDQAAPSTSASLSGTAGTNGWYTSAVSVTLSATDTTSGVATTYYAVDNSSCTSAALGNCSTYSGAFNVTSDGTHTVYFFSKDSAGNYEAQKTQQVKIDTVAPSASASLSGTAGLNGWYVSAVTVTLSGTDTTSGVATTYYAVDNADCTSAALGNCSTYSSSFSISTDGAHTVYFFAKDNAGNYGSQQTQAVNIDATAPAEPSGLSASPGAASGSIDVSWSAVTDAASGLGEYVAYYKQHSGAGCPNGVYDSSTSAGTSTSKTVTGLTPNKKHCFYVVAKDNAGNVSTDNNRVSATSTP